MYSIENPEPGTSTRPHKELLNDLVRQPAVCVSMARAGAGVFAERFEYAVSTMITAAMEKM